MFPTQLSAPLSDESLLAGPGAELTIIGGATTGGSPAPGIFTFDTGTGRLQHVADLTSPLKDSAGAVISGQDVVFGGDSPTVLSTVQAVSVPAAAGPGTSNNSTSPTVPTAAVVGALPQPRADSTAVTIGTTTYLVGGDDGTTADPSVLATTDGRSFKSVASLAVAVRSPAVAASGRTIYVFGGETAGASGTWAPSDEIQSVVPATHKAKVIGHLPEALSGACAVTVDSQILVLGGAGTATGAGTAAPAITANSDIWWFDAARHLVVPVAQLPVAVSGAASTVVGSTVWVVGEESGSTPVSAVQSVTVSAVSAKKAEKSRRGT